MVSGKRKFVLPMSGLKGGISYDVLMQRSFWKRQITEKGHEVSDASCTSLRLETHLMLTGLPKKQLRYISAFLCIRGYKICLESVLGGRKMEQQLHSTGPHSAKSCYNINVYPRRHDEQKTILPICWSPSEAGSSR